MKWAITGRRCLGAVQMRGVEIAKLLGVPFIDLSRVHKSDKWDTLVLIKYWHSRGRTHHNDVRRACDRLIYDPMDSWSSTSPDAHPDDFWKWTHDKLEYDELILASPSAMQSAVSLPIPSMSFHMLPHHHDPRVDADWYDPNGPVVYAGGFRFIKKEWGLIQNACKKLGKHTVLDHSKDCWKSLQGASLVLHPRFAPEDTLMNRLCKPQVKAANSAWCQIPILATSHPCFSSLYKDGYRHNPELGWVTNIERALASQPIQTVISAGQHAVGLHMVVEGQIA